MKLDELTPQEHEDLRVWQTNMRTLIAMLGRVAKQVDVPALVAFATIRVAPILEKLDATEVPPNPTGYAGSRDMTVAELIALRTAAHGLIAALEQSRPLMLAAAGINAE